MDATRVQIPVFPYSDLMKEQKFHVGVKALILNEKNEILLLKANPARFESDMVAHWDVPGGRIQENSGIEDTLKKELGEELGVDDVEILDLFDAVVSNFKIPDGDEKVGLLLLIYQCKLHKNEKFKLSFEHTEYKWADVGEARELLSFKFPKSFTDKLTFFE